MILISACNPKNSPVVCSPADNMIMELTEMDHLGGLGIVPMALSKDLKV
jgi:hypothetical protein